MEAELVSDEPEHGVPFVGGVERLRSTKTPSRGAPRLLVSGPACLSKVRAVCLAHTMADNAIHGTEWTVQELGGAVTADPRPVLAFGDDGRLTGTTGVNRIMGQFEVQDGMLVVSGTATTRMAGPPEAMDQEQRLLDLLGSAQAFVITGDRLEVGDGETLAVLVRPSTQPEQRRSDHTTAEHG
jgi:heat shock protein HslJ